MRHSIHKTTHIQPEWYQSVHHSK